MECHKIKKVEYLKDYQLKLRFNDRKTKIVDLWPRIKNAKGIMQPLKDIEYFKQVSCDGITILWPNGVDLCPDFLYMMGKDMEETAKKPSRIKRQTSSVSRRIKESSVIKSR